MGNGIYFQGEIKICFNNPCLVLKYFPFSVQHFTGKTTTSTDGEEKIRRWIKIEKRDEEILPLTKVTNVYADSSRSLIR